MLIYTGIGARITPDNVQSTMTSIATQLAEHWTLRSGHGEADWAFEIGVLQHADKHKIKPKMEIYIPWPGFNAHLERDEILNPKSLIVPNFIVTRSNEELIRVAALFHPAWSKCSPAAKFIHMRHVCQIAGEDLNTPTDMVVCWTPRGKREGGTGQSLRIAEYLKIPIFDLALPEAHQELCKFVSKKEQEHHARKKPDLSNVSGVPCSA